MFEFHEKNFQYEGQRLLSRPGQLNLLMNIERNKQKWDYYLKERRKSNDLHRPPSPPLSHPITTASASVASTPQTETLVAYSESPVFAARVPAPAAVSPPSDLTGAARWQTTPAGPRGVGVLDLSLSTAADSHSHSHSHGHSSTSGIAVEPLSPSAAALYKTVAASSACPPSNAAASNVPLTFKLLAYGLGLSTSTVLFVWV